MPSASAALLRLRADVYDAIRTFFTRRGVLEVHTPVLTRAGVTDLHIASVPVSSAGTPAGFLRTSPEYFHKRLLAAGAGDLFELGPVFRDGEAGCRHNPEFTLLEWYRVGWTYEQLMDETVELVRAVAGGRLDDRPLSRLTWRQAFIQATGADPCGLDSAKLAAMAPEAPTGLDHAGLLDWLFATRVQPDLPETGITLINEFPVEQAALARISPGDPPVALRFELFLGQLELANGYQELTDPTEQRRRFERDNEQRAARGLPVMPMDEPFLAALEAGLPESAGVALGVDRLLMVLAGCDDIGEVLAFPWA